MSDYERNFYLERLRRSFSETQETIIITAHAKIYDDLKQGLRRLYEWSVERTPTGERCIDLLPDEELFFINDLLVDLEDALTGKRCRPGHAAVRGVNLKDQPAGHTLSAAEKRKLAECFRGLFYRGFSPDDAARLLGSFGWWVAASDDAV